MAIRMRLESKTGQAITEEIDPEDIEDCPYDLWALPADAKQNSHGGSCRLWHYQGGVKMLARACYEYRMVIRS